MAVRHVIFDCDGVLVDSEPISMRADVRILKRFGIHMDEHEAHEKFVGKTFEAMLDMMRAEHGVVFPPGLHKVKNDLVEALYLTDLRIVPGVRDVLADLKARGISCSVASNSPRRRIDLTLRLMRLAEHFTHVVTFEDVKNGKPAPDVFLKAAEMAGVPATDCLVVEDSTTGVTAAVAARIATIGFVGTHHEPLTHARRLIELGAMETASAMQDVAGLI
ncbi:MAG: HAD family phosphatase [Hyphomicrobiales bacterium]